ncbi:DUF934 domain-containing protein [Paenalcaligenes sp. Me131]|uniref:DUF934 domain-containing protein n=1 Tax=Paenalcaligenes sp. Me131 TaxID=3392636 RepID=UPI003D2E987F
MLFDAEGRVKAETWWYPEQEGAAEQPASQRIIALENWEAYHAETGEYAAGVWVNSYHNITELLPVLDKVQLVAIGFAQTRDGRGFTLAKLLRERHGFTGDIRAVGPLLPDQFVMLLQCGISSVASSTTFPATRWEEAAKTYTHQQSSPLTLLHRLRSAPVKEAVSSTS